MRRCAADKLRLALRKVMPRLMAFAFSPTAEEFGRIVAKVLADSTFSAVLEASRQESREGQALH